MLNSIGKRTEPCVTTFFILLSILRCPSLVCTTKIRFDYISMMKLSMYLSGMVFKAFSGGVHGATLCHKNAAAVKSRNTNFFLSQLARCAESCLRYIVLVVLLGPPLIYHGGSRLVSEGAVDPPLDRCGCVPTSPESWTGRRAVRWVCSCDLGSCTRLFGFGMATTLARRQVFGSVALRKHYVKNEHSQAVVFALWWMTNFGWMLSRPGAFPDFNFVMTGRFKLFYCKVGRHVGIGGGCCRKRGDFKRRPACEVSVCIWEASVIQKLRVYWTATVRHTSACQPCQLVYVLAHLATWMCEVHRLHYLSSPGPAYFIQLVE